MVDEVDVQRKVEMNLIAVNDHLKFGLFTHLMKCAGPIRDVEFPLLRSSVDSSEKHLFSLCKYFMAIFRIFVGIAKAFSDIPADLRDEKDDARNKLVPFLRHHI